jgi:hypothetical protein
LGLDVVTSEDGAAWLAFIRGIVARGWPTGVEAGLFVNTWITDHHRLSVYNDLAHDHDELELYDLDNDPGEHDSLATDPSQQPLLTSLLAQLLRHRTQITAPWPKRVSGA